MKRIHTLIRVLTPLHIAAPSSVRFDASTGNMSMSAEGTMPCTGVQKMPVVPAEADKDIAYYPVIAANNVAGRLRRHAARIVLDVLKSKGQRVSLATYGTLQCGAWTGKPDGEDMRYGEYLEAKNHPYLGLFGGGPKLMRKGFRLHNALPAVADIRALLGHLAHPHGDGVMNNIPAHRMTKAWGFRRNDDLRDLVGMSAAASTVDDFERVFDERQTKIIEEQAKGKDGDGSRTSTKTYSALEFVLPGTMFDTSFEMLDGVTDAQMGLFLLSLDSFANTERLGGYVRNGFGVVSFASVVMVDESGAESSIFNNGRLNLANELVAGYVSAWHEAAEDLDAARLDAMLRPSEKKEKAKKDKAAAAATAGV